MTMMRSSSATDAAALAFAFAEALADGGPTAVKALLAQQIDFCAVTPRRTWDASSDEEVLEILGRWFPKTTVLERLVAVETDEVVDRRRLRYRLHGHNQEGRFEIEQQAYLDVRDGRIDWMRLLCSGFRPL
ncbi:MAG: hypothetical protein ACYDHN_07820 [Solirubrobacteraceae bacterium]